MDRNGAGYEICDSSLQRPRTRGKIAEVRVSQRKFVNGGARILLVSSLAAFLFLVLFVALQWRPSKVIEKRQASLIDGIERRNPARIQRLVSPNYHDRWEFTREDIVETLVDSGSQFMALVVTREDESVVFEKSRATVTVHLIISGKPVGPAGNEVTRRVNQLKEPFVFVWEKESFLPSSWRLVKVDNAGLPDELYGYEPGDIRRAMRGE